jgi:hypothetical protein
VIRPTLLALLVLTSCTFGHQDFADLGCITDSECMELCMPDEPGCDGGPAPVDTLVRI